MNDVLKDEESSSPRFVSTLFISANFFSPFTFVFTMYSRLFLTACLAVFASATPAPEKRQALARVVSSCVNPNTVALTFVSHLPS